MTTNEAPKSTERVFNEPDDRTNPTVEHPDLTKITRTPPQTKSPPVTVPAIKPAGATRPPDPEAPGPANPQTWDGSK